LTVKNLNSDLHRCIYNHYNAEKNSIESWYED